ncbi:srk1 Serine/threonine-protein kinase srk1 [Candida maltosa Xu316]
MTTRSSTDSSTTNYSLYTTTTRSSESNASYHEDEHELLGKTSFTFDSTLNNLYPDLPNNYKLLNVLGEGAFSIVYKAINLSNNQTIAVKVINKLNLTSKQLRNITNEIKIMEKIHHHENIIELIDVIDSLHSTFLIVEYCNGGEIFDQILKYTYLSEDLSCHVFKQILKSIEYLHNLNIVHRDIKPENLLFKKIPFMERSHEDYVASLRKSDDTTKVDEGEFKYGVGGGTIGIIKLADFGLAKILNSNTFAKTPCGTTGYTAPEVFVCNDLNNNNNHKKSYNSYSKAVDIWSLGCVLYTVLCGFPPFYDENIETLTDNVTRANFTFLKPWWDEISGDAKDLITKMLSIDPEKRITIQEIWAHPWIINHSKVTVDDSPATTKGYFPHGYDTTNLEQDDENNDLLHVPTKNSQPILSPRAIAIKKVFDNPAMTNEGHTNQPTSHFIEDIAEESESELDSDAEEYDVDPVPSRGYVRTPFPKEVNFKDVFTIGAMNYEDEDGSDDGSDDDDEFDEEVSELGDELTSLNISQFSPRFVEDVHQDDDYSSTNSANSEEDNGIEEYQTRSSSIISGLNGDFKFTLNLNNSNLLARRKNSII